MESTLTKRSRIFHFPSGILAALLIIISVNLGFGQTTIFTENMGTPAGTTTIVAYVGGTAPATFQNNGAGANLTYSNGAQTNPADLRVTNVSSGYTGASGGGNIFETTTSGAYGFSIESINASIYTGLTLQFGYRKENAASHATFSVDYWDGAAWQVVANTSGALFNEAAGATVGWYLSKSLTLPAGAQINGLKIRFVKTGTLAIRIDDVKLTGTGPTISQPAAITGLNYTGAGPSAWQSYTFTGSSLSPAAGNITVAGTTNFEVSSDGITAAGGNSYTVAYSGGALASTTTYVRLKAGLAAATYGPVTGVTLAGGGATTINVSTTGTVTSASPTLTPSVGSLTGFTYPLGSGPSTSQTLNLTGASLTGAPNNITITGSAAFEVSSDNITFGATALIPYSSATLASTPFYVRLKAGMAQATYSSQTIGIAGGGASSSITASGTVTAAINFTLSNLALFQIADNTSSNTTASIVEINRTTAAQSAINTYSINGTSGANSLRFTGSATSAGYLATTNDGTLLSFVGHNTTTSAGNINTILPRGVGTLTSNFVFNLPATYAGTTGNQTRGATSIDNSAYYIIDQIGLFSNGGATTPTFAANKRCAKAFGGTVYSMANSATNTVVSFATPTDITATTLNGFASSGITPIDFYMIQSGVNGTTYDVMYFVTATGILKYSLVAGLWTANGSYTAAGGGFGITALRLGIGAEIFFSTGGGATAANSIIKVTDLAGYNTTINVNTPSNVTLYTATGTNTVKGISLAPISASAPKINIGSTILNGFTYAGSGPGTGPSVEQSFTVSGSNLGVNPIALNVDANYEISLTSGGTFVNSLNLNPTAGSVALTTVYVRLKANLAAGSYNNKLITLTTTSGYTQYVILNGALLPTVNVSVSASAGTEVGTTAITVTATSNSTLTSNETVDLTVTGTSISSGDYTLVDGDGTLAGIQIKILSGATTGTSTFTVVNDNLNEGTETATINISNPSAGLYLGTTITQNVTITDNDDAVIVTVIGTPSATTDFNNIIVSGTSTEVSTGAYYLETGTNQNLILTAGDGNLSTGDTYSFGTGATSDRALGSSITSGLADVKVGFKITNSTGTTFNALIVNYNGEQWRRGVTGNASNGGAPARDKLKFEYSSTATSLATGTWGSSSILNFYSPDYGTTSTDNPRNGNAGAYRQAIMDTVFLPASVANGASTWVRWTHNNTGTFGTRDGLGVDDVTFTPINFTPSIFYSDSTGNLDQLGSWWTNNDGTGANPTSFTASNQTFIVQHRLTTATLGANWTVSGSNSKVLIRTNCTVTIPDAFSFVGVVDSLEGTATLNLNNATVPTLNGIEPNTTVVYGSLSNQDIAVPTSTNNQYGNLTFTGAGVKRIIGGYRVEGDYTFTNASVNASTTFSVVFFKKDITVNGTITYSTNYNTYVNLQAYGSNTQQLVGNGNAINAGRLLMNVANTSGTLISSGSDLKTGSLSLAATTNLVLSDDIKLNTNAGASSFADNANTITIGGDLECAGNTASYSFTGSIILNGATGTANIRQDGSGGSASVIKASINNLSIQTSGTTVTQVQPSSGSANVIIKGDFTIAGTSTGKFTPNGNTIKIAGDFTDSRTIDMIASGTSTFEFNGTSGAQSFSTSYAAGESFNNVTISNSNGVTLTSGNMKISGTGNLDCSLGGITTGANKVILSATATISETDANNVLGNVETTRVLTNALQQFGGMGLEITAAGAQPGSTVVLRNTGNSQDIGCSSSSVLRKFTITPTVNTGLNATVNYYYLTSELNSLPEAGLALYNGSSPWISLSTSVNTALNAVSATAVNSFNNLVAASAALPVTNVTSTTIDASNPSRMLEVTAPLANTNYTWSPASDLYTDAALTIPYVLGTPILTVYAAPFSTVTYNVTATNTLIACNTSPTAILVTVDPAITNDICLANLPAGLINVTSTPNYILRSLTGATASPGAACVGINKDIWFRAVVPANGEVHVITQEHNDPTVSLNITSALVQIFTATTCSTGLSQVACNSGGAAANMAYAAATGLTPGSTVYIRLARTTAGNAAPAQFIKMAVTNGLYWTGAADNNFTNAANWSGGDVSALTTPSVNSTVIIPTLVSNVYPVINGTQNVHGVEFINSIGNNNIPSITINAGAELRLTASATYKSYINRSGFYAYLQTTAPRFLGTGTLRFNEGGLNTGAVLSLTRFYGVVAVRAGVSVASNGNMSFENNSVLLSGGVATADLTKNYSGTVTGNINYNRSGSLYGGYNYWSSPVTAATTSVLASNYGNNVYQYDNQIAGSGTNPQLAWGSAITSPTVMTPGRGYIQTYAGNGNVKFVGTSNEGTVNIPVTVNGSNTFNLLGNPYPSALSYSSLKATNANLGSVYLWSFSGNIPYNSSSYVVMSGLGVLSGNIVAGFNSAEIGAGQGFLAQVSGAGSISFNSNQRVPNYPGNSTQFLDNDSPYSILRLRLTNPNQISFDAVVGFGETGTDGVDFGFDSPRMPSSEVLELYTMLGDDQFTTQYLPVLNTARVIDLGVVMATAGTYSFDLNLFDNFDPTVRVFLEDRKTGEFHNMNASSNYSFTNDPAFVGTRFRLHFMAPFAYSSTGSCTNENTGKVILSNPNQNYPMQARIKNTAGEVVMAKDSVMAEYIFTGLAPQSYSMETSYDGTEFNSTLIDIQGFEAFENAGITSSASSISLDKAIVEFSTVQIAGAEYTWNFGDQTSLVAGANVSHAYMQTGIYTVTLSISNGGCTSTSSYEIAITDDVTGIANVTDGNQLIAFPNPANELVKILRSDSRQAVLELTDITGKVVLRKTLTNSVETISTSDLKAGTYLAVIRDNKTTRTIRVVVAH